MFQVTSQWLSVHIHNLKEEELLAIVCCYSNLVRFYSYRMFIVQTFWNFFPFILSFIDGIVVEGLFYSPARS